MKLSIISLVFKNSCCHVAKLNISLVSLVMMDRELSFEANLDLLCSSPVSLRKISIKHIPDIYPHKMVY